ncbi:MAG TPA: arginine deiminase family protein [Bryobacteraceae bacterium]|nr:arginine deiminase family protein [Bryobacteraceae bacterium]
MLQALTRQVSSTFASCELTYLEREPIDVERAVQQHRAYETALAELGARVFSLPSDDAYPDGVFVEDPAIVLDEVAVIARPGALSRRGEAESIARALEPFRELRRITAPATLEGGDVIRVGKALYVGLSKRTNREGIGQLQETLSLFGYRVIAVDVSGCLHLKSGACWAGGETILANRKWIDTSVFEGLHLLDVAEPAAADVLPIGGSVLIPASFPRTAEILASAGFRVRPMDVSELRKAEAGVTCMSLLFETQG